MVKLFPVIIILLFIYNPLKSQNDNTVHDSLKVRDGFILKAAAYTSAYYAGSLFILSKTWYKDKEVVPFHFYNDIGGYNQIDKLGHVYGAYVYSYIGYNLLKNSGLTR